MSFFTINHNHEREPFFTFSVQEINIWGLAVVHESTYGFFAPSIAFWIQCLSVLGIMAVFAAMMSFVIFHHIISCRGTYSSFVVGYGVLLPLCIVIPTYLLTILDISNQTVSFCMVAIVPALTAFRTMEAMHGCSPKSAELSFCNYAIYYTCPMEIQFDPKTKKTATATMKEKVSCLTRFIWNAALLGFYKSILAPYRYEVYESAVDANSVDFAPFDILDWGLFRNNVLGAILFQQYLTTFMFGIGAAQMIISGIKSVEGMHNPIFTCSSPSDFWGKKWNLIIHGALKRGIFKPVYKHSNKQTAALASFLVSGIYHEWIVAVMFLGPANTKCMDQQQPCFSPGLGRSVAFFMWNAIFILLEHHFGASYIFQWMKKNVPAPIRTFLVVMLAMPVAHWFMHAYFKSEIFVDGQAGFPMIMKIS